MLHKTTFSAVVMFMALLVSCGLQNKNTRSIAYIWQPENIVEKYTDEVCGMAGEEIYILKKKDGKQYIEFYNIEGKTLRTMPLDKYDITDKTTIKFIKNYKDSYLLCPIEQKQILNINSGIQRTPIKFTKTESIGYADIMSHYVLYISDFYYIYNYIYFYISEPEPGPVAITTYQDGDDFLKNNNNNPAKIITDKKNRAYFVNLNNPPTINVFSYSETINFGYVATYQIEREIKNDFQWVKIGEEYFPSGHVVISSLGYDEKYLYIPRTGGMYYTETPPRPIPYEFGIDILDKNTGEHKGTLSVPQLKNLSGMAYILGVTDKHIVLLMNDFSKSFDSYKRSQAASNWFIVVINKE